MAGRCRCPSTSPTNRLTFLETDPVEVQIQLSEGDLQTIEFLDRHCGYFTFGENYGRTPEVRPAGLGPLRLPPDAPARGPRLLAPRGRASRYDVHDHRQLAATPAGGLPGRAAHLEQAPGVPQVSRSTLPRRPGFQTALQQGTKSRIGKCFGAKAGRCGTRSSFPLISTSIAITSPRLERVHGRQGPEHPAPRLAGSVIAAHDISGGGPAGGHSGYRLQRLYTPASDGYRAVRILGLGRRRAVEAINADYATHSRGAADLTAREHFDSDVVLSRLLEELGER